MIVAKVRFAPGARTAWHSHALGQTLHVTRGVAWVHSRCGEKVQAHAGQTIYCPPVEEPSTSLTRSIWRDHAAKH